jgi:hypothetical protein
MKCDTQPARTFFLRPCLSSKKRAIRTPLDPCFVYEIA